MFPLGQMQTVAKLSIKKKSDPLSNVGTHHFLPGAQHPQFSEADVERGALERPVRLSDHDHVDAAWQSGLIDPLIQLLHRHQHLARQLPHVVHGVHLSANIPFIN